MDKVRVNLTECPKQRFPGDRKFKNIETPMNNKGCDGKSSEKK